MKGRGTGQASTLFAVAFSNPLILNIVRKFRFPVNGATFIFRWLKFLVTGRGEILNAMLVPEMTPKMVGARLAAIDAVLFSPVRCCFFLRDTRFTASHSVLI